MFDSTPIPRDENALRWARGVLGVPEEAPAERIRGISLARLEETEFTPPAQWEQAILLLADDSPESLWQRDLGYEMYRAREVALRKEVEQFIRDFFSLAPTERCKRYEVLTAACSFSLPLTAWLEALKPGLNGVPIEVEDKNKLTRELAVFVRGLFPLPPTQRLAVEEEFLHRASFDSKNWQKAARRFRKRYPQNACLMPVLCERLSNFVKNCAAEKKAEIRRIQANAKANSRKILSKGKNTLPLTIFAMIVLNAIRIATNNFNSPSSNNYPSYDRPAPVQRAPSVQPEVDYFKPISVKSLKPDDPPPSSREMKNVGNAYRRMMGIPADAKVYIDDGNSIIYQEKASEQNDSLEDKAHP